MKSIILILFILISCWVQGQSSIGNEISLAEHEKIIADLIDRMARMDAGPVRDSLNHQLRKEWSDFHTSPQSLDYDLSKIKLISILTNEDKNFRILTWELENAHGEIAYHGVVAYKDSERIQVVELQDQSDVLKNAEAQKRILKSHSWYGAMYYDMKTFQYKGKKHFILLGIQRKEELTKKKIIEVASIETGLEFGKEVFDYEDDGGLKRLIFEYAYEADMSVWFEEGEDNLILMDHLSPLKPMYQEKFEYYAPDLSFDALEFKKGRWKHISDYDAKRGKRLNDRFFEMDLPEQKKMY